jgi:hypothetical protein
VQGNESAIAYYSCLFHPSCIIPGNNFIHPYEIKIWDVEVVEQVNQMDVKAMGVAAREVVTV